MRMTGQEGRTKSPELVQRPVRRRAWGPKRVPKGERKGHTSSEFCGPAVTPPGGAFVNQPSRRVDHGGNPLPKPPPPSLNLAVPWPKNGVHLHSEVPGKRLQSASFKNANPIGSWTTTMPPVHHAEVAESQPSDVWVELAVLGTRRLRHN